MRVGLARLPRLLTTLVLAFALEDPESPLAVALLCRGRLVQLVQRWASRQLLADDRDRAVLLWYVERGQVPWRRRLAGAGAGVVAGALGFMTAGLVVASVVHAISRLLGATVEEGVASGAGVFLVRLSALAWWAVRAFRTTRTFERCLPPTTDAPRWWLDYVAAVPARRGHGSALVRRFLALADEQGAEVALRCRPPLVPYYRRFGFEQVTAHVVAPHCVMLRRPHRSGPRPTALRIGRAAVQ